MGVTGANATYDPKTLTTNQGSNPHSWAQIDLLSLPTYDPPYQVLVGPNTYQVAYTYVYDLDGVTTESPLSPIAKVYDSLPATSNGNSICTALQINVTDYGTGGGHLWLPTIADSGVPPIAPTGATLTSYNLYVLGVSIGNGSQWVQFTPDSPTAGYIYASLPSELTIRDQYVNAPPVGCTTLCAWAQTISPQDITRGSAVTRSAACTSCSKDWTLVKIKAIFCTG